MAYPVPDPYKAAVRSGLTITYSVDALYKGNPVVGATGMSPIGGSITDTTKQVLRRTLNLDVAGTSSLYDLLSPAGTRLLVTATVEYTNQTSVRIPMGMFIIDQVTYAEGEGKLSITAPDLGIIVQRARFMQPQASSPATTAVQQIVTLLSGALGSGVPINVTSTSTVRVGSLVWQQDRAQAISDLATAAGVWVYADRSGNFVIQDTPTISADADWMVDASPSGVLITLDRQKSRTRTYNVVVVDSSATSGALFLTQYVWDGDPSSPTYAGPGPFGGVPPNAASAGPFGLVPYFHSDPVVDTSSGAVNAGLAILSRTVGIASQVNATQVPNPALDAFDRIDVMAPGYMAASLSESTLTAGPGGPFGVGPFGSTPFGLGVGQATRTYTSTYRAGPLERHVADQVTHSLDVTAAQQIQGRSTRSDPYS